VDLPTISSEKRAYLLTFERRLSGASIATEKHRVSLKFDTHQSLSFVEDYADKSVTAS